MDEWLSHEALESAWQHVAVNGGCAGADGVTLDQFAQTREAAMLELRQRIEHDEYRPLPLLPIAVEKHLHSNAIRILQVPAVRDRILQTAAGRQLGRAFEDDFLECSFAYRPHRSVDSAAARIRFLHDHGYRYIVEADIENFFDRVDHNLLRCRLDQCLPDRRMRELLALWIQCPSWDGHQIRPRHAGIPQGSPISPLLANFFLTDFDLALEKQGLKPVRYADDFLILARDAGQAQLALEIAGNQLEALHLRLKREKTRIASFEEGFHFLGLYFLGPDLWIPWKVHHQHRRVLSVPPPMPARLVKQLLEPPTVTAFQAAWRKAREFPAENPQAETGQTDMAYLYLTEQGAVLRKIGNRLVVEKDEAVLLDLPYHKLSAVLLFGNVQVTTQAMAELLDAGIPVNLLSRQGEFRGSLMPPQGKNIPRRIAQFELYRDSSRCLQLAARITAAKLLNSAAVLEQFGDRDAARDEMCRMAIAEIRAAAEKTSSAASPEMLDGIEGAAAKLYFSILMQRNKSEFTWPGRVKHPATDPINALLSFGYTLVAHELAGLLEAVGLDPYLGVLHQLDYGRKSLAQDLIEPFRAPVVDRLILTLLNRRQFSKDDFEPAIGGADAGLYLRPEPAKRFLIEYERWMLRCSSPAASDTAALAAAQNFRATLRAEVERFTATVRDSKREYAPFAWPLGMTLSPSVAKAAGEAQA